ncbi:glycerol-3-phosphate dehydrogenase subunit GlpB [Cedecea neteri]|uniref:glycerol-3-phosphate dehydrogenase subunit GlpB n=1 Tax=Cedecea neteri TaxID=158822 RepID=UPI0028A0486B|nr:glycerol-3-phosphate dehydrogenase subunit GlpB [Cedecea neteri]
MKFDTIIIGSGLAGLTAGIKLAESGQRCAIVSRGQSALHFSSGSLDLLSTLPDGTPIHQPETALENLAEQAPQHPYSLMGKERVLTFAAESEQLLARADIPLVGHYRQNHLRITPLGKQRASWLSPPEVPQAPLLWQKVTVINIAGFLDFQAELVAGSLSATGCNAHVAELTLPVLDVLRNNPSEFRAVNIARVLDLPENLPALVEELRLLLGSGEAMILPACLNLEARTVAAVEQALGVPVKLLPTLPPSVLGMRLHHALCRRFQTLGGFIMPGDTVTGAQLEQGRINALFTKNHREVPLRTRNIILASGSFFSGGLEATRQHVIEPIFGLDVNIQAERAAWSKTDFFTPQPWLQFGLTVNHHFQPSHHGEHTKNLYAIGSVLGGFDPIQQGCGAGVSMLTALCVADQILVTAEACHEPA